MDIVVPQLGESVIEARVAHAIFARGEQREQRLKADGVPRVSERSAADPAVQQILDFVEESSRFGRLAALDGEMSRGEAQPYFRKQAHRNRVNVRGPLPARPRVTHLREEQGQVALLQFNGAAIRRRVFRITGDRSRLALRQPGAERRPRHEIERRLSSVGLAKVKAATVGFQPLFRYRRFFGELTSIRLNSWLQWLADHNVPGIRSSGMDYIVLARKRVTDN